ncbi:MAG: cytochrome b/b6 [Proteobacteria bacterium]|nr:cytochrome b/b6 [Pseudomonadota bacterium]
MSPLEKQSGLIGWIDHRLPFLNFVNNHLKNYQTPKNLSYLWNFGSLAGVTLVIMILSGIFLAMHYTPHVDHAFDSIQHIMRDVNNGWMMRYIHMNGASMFFIVVYIHMFRSMYYGSYKQPRELLWIFGCVIFLIMMATAFMGYVLPWGQMSYWGATVITNLFSTIPFIGTKIVEWFWGGYSIGNPTLNRFFVIHYLLPFILVFLTILHLIALHQFGSNNPKGIDVDKKSGKDTIPFHPYYTIKDYFGLIVFLLIFAGVVFFAPNMFSEPDNSMPANPLVTPPHIVPEWYFLPFYAILRSIPNKLLGVIAMFGSILMLFILPWLDRHPTRSARYRPWFKPLFWLFFINTFILGWVGANPPEGMVLTIGLLSTLYYFFHFMILLPLLTLYEPRLPLPKEL